MMFRVMALGSALVTGLLIIAKVPVNMGHGIVLFGLSVAGIVETFMLGPQK